jgi:type II secretory pathway component PulF
MVAYVCKARDENGALVEKTVDAASERGAIQTLEQHGLVPITIRSASQETSGPGSAAVVRPTQGGARLKPKQLLQLSLRLGSSLQAGVPVLGALRLIGKQSSHPVLGAIMAQLATDVEGGMPLSDAMRRFPRAFPELYVSTIAAGEKTGGLDQALFNLTDYLEGEIELRAQLRSALMYPTIVVGALCLAVGVLVVFIVPRFAVFYSGFKVELPLPTKILVGGSSFVSDHGLWVLLGLAGLVTGAVRFARTPLGRRWIDRAVLRIPVIGHLIDTAITLRTVQMLGVTVNAGLPLLDGIEVMASATTNTKYKDDLRAVVGGIVAGESMADSMEAAGCFQPSARQMLASGEATGSMGTACEALARHLRKELRYLTKDLTTLIEPALTLCLAVVVLFVALAAFLPMWDMTKVISR